MQKRVGLCYKTLLINCNRHTHGENAVIKSTVNLAFRRLKPKMKKNPENTTRNRE